MDFKLDDLPYSYDALGSYMSKETLEYHHDLHHKAYVDNLNLFIKDHPHMQGKSLEEVVKMSHDESIAPIFNNAGQHLNHNIFWQSMALNTTPSDKLKSVISENFGSWDAFRDEFIKGGMKVFGSGWIWLALNKDNKLELIPYQGAGNPVVDSKKPILGADVWEHSYYIDYRNKRAKYLENFIDFLVNWDYVEKQLGL